MSFAFAVLCFGAVLFGVASAQQYAGDFINTTLPGVPGSEIAYWKIRDGTKGSNLTLINYINHGRDGQRLVPANLKRAVIIIHGLNRDPGTYESNMLSALSQVSDTNINPDSVAIVAPYFPNGDDKNTGGYPWINGLKPAQGSITNCLVWSGSQWSAGGMNQYPWTSSKNISSYDVLDQMLQYFDNKAMFPNINQLVVAGHSLGGQTVQRYAAIGQPGSVKTPVSYWVANPNSYAWLSTDRPLSTSSCATFDNYREGYTNFSQYPMTYGLSLVNSGRANILANFNNKAVNYARGTLDLGDDSSSCAPGTTGANRNERFFNFIKAFPPSCSDPSGNACDTVDFIASGHDGGAMMASAAGQARLFIDNFYGDRNRSYDFGYPRQQSGDDPFPNPALNQSTAATNNYTYAGQMTYWGCWSDQDPATLTNLAYEGLNNTVESCTALCASRGNTIAGTENGNQCFCGSSVGYLATQVIDSSCGTTCTGNNAETCGGANRLSLFSAGRPNISAAPGTPEVISNDWYYTSCSVDNAGRVRALGDRSTTSDSMTLEKCGNFCQGSQYFGIEYSSECYCGNSLSSSSIAASSDCNMLCSGDSTEFCGAGNRLTVYQNTTWVAPSKTSSSSAASGTPTATGPACPSSDGKTVTSGGKSFIVECGVDHAGGDLTSLSGRSACYLKSSLGAAVNNGGVWGARLMVPSTSSQTSSSTSGTTTSVRSTSVAFTSATSSTAAFTSPGTSSTSSSASAASSTVVACPTSDATTVTSNGKSFIVECGIDHSGGDLTSLSVNNFQQCIDACAQNPACVDMSLSGSACYLKSTVGEVVNNGVWGARLLTGTTSSTLVPIGSSLANPATTSTSTSLSLAPSTFSTSFAVATPSAVTCPGSNSTTYQSGGQSWLIECGVDHAGGDMGSLSASSFAACIAACASTSGCVDVSLSGSACYLKSSVGAPVYNGVWGARAISVSTSAASTTTSALVTTSSSAISATATASTQMSSTSITTFATSTSISTLSSSTASATPTALACPAGNNTLYTAPSGNTFLIECNIDHAGGDLSWSYVSSFTDCIDSCDSTAGCVDVSLAGAACYRKSTLGAAVSNGGVWGAKLVGSTSSIAVGSSSTSSA
ncbi:hypothetical protein LTR78_005246 [Recurvomyces mirabilis]|uniref:WSC domain-containing protein n=1 Tax=Recurvomyces mirabilis TaxID=574656 RepID=A0AAE0WNB9_9PEZI|nr:hypothetical protein LTR78_005246 [Recurvomyces mirabilis]KAK5157796.1 hypothetical protein LTS14_003718 [Recurvomyces mirabilis]